MTPTRIILCILLLCSACSFIDIRRATEDDCKALWTHMVGVQCGQGVFGKMCSGFTTFVARFGSSRDTFLQECTQKVSKRHVHCALQEKKQQKLCRVDGEPEHINQQEVTTTRSAAPTTTPGLTPNAFARSAMIDMFLMISR